MPRPPITKARPYTPQSGAFKGRTFHTEREYRNALAKLKGFGSWHEQQRAAKKVTPKSFGDLRPSQKQARARALDALSKVRHGETLTRAAKEAGTTPNTVARYAGEQLQPRAWAHGRQPGRPPLSPHERGHDRRRSGSTCAARGRRRLPASTPTRSRRSSLSRRRLVELALRKLREFEGVTVAASSKHGRRSSKNSERTGELEFEVLYRDEGDTMNPDTKNPAPKGGRKKQQGTRRVVCPWCGEKDPTGLKSLLGHHIAGGRATCPDLTIRLCPRLR